MKCTICHASKTIATGKRYDDRYGYPGSFELYKCPACGHLSLEARFSPQELTTLYTNYYPRKALDVESHRPHRETSGIAAWLRGDQASTFRWIPPKVRVLDIGCGFGESLGYHQSRGCDVQGVEADENIRRVADRFGYKVHVGLFDPTMYEADYFDFVTMSQVIEHVVDPQHTLGGIHRILKPGGIAILSTPNSHGWGAHVFGKRWINWHAPYHLHFFSVRSMRIAAKRAGLKLEKTTTITPSAWLLYQWIHLACYPAEGNSSVFWTPGLAKSGNQRLILRLLNTLHTFWINHIITRIFDMLNIGDNRLYFLRKP